MLKQEVFYIVRQLLFYFFSSRILSKLTIIEKF